MRKKCPSTDQTLPVPAGETLRYIAEAIKSAWRRPFRGDIWECPTILQNGYAVKGAFDIQTARHLIWPLKAIRAAHVQLVSVMAAVQTLKSLLADLTVRYWLEHDPGDTLWLFEDEPKAKLYAESRAMPMIESVPEIKALLAGLPRFDKTKTMIKLRHMNLCLAGLNLGNVQTISWQRVIIDELWMHKSDGLVRQAKDRTKQFPDTRKIILLGQGGIEDDDADREHKQTVRYELHYACPECGRYQPFELSRERLAAGQHDKGPKYAGLNWDTNERTRPGGAHDGHHSWDYQEVGKTAHHTCFYCGFRIEDVPEVRRSLNDSYTYFLQGEEPCAKTEIKEPLPAQIGFHWPAEASMRIPFSDLVIKLLRANEAAEELGYRLPLQEFHQKDRGVSWSDALEGDFRQMSYEPYDVHADFGDFIVLLVDCQRDLAKFFFHVYAMALTGETRMLDRGKLESFDAIAKKQEEWKTKDQHVFLDCGYQMTKVLRECVKHGHVGRIRIGGKVREMWLCWTGMKGSGIELFRHKSPRTGLPEQKIFSETKYYNVNVGTKDRHPLAPYFEWSNLHCKDLMAMRRDGDPTAPKWLVLPDTLPANDPWSYFGQMRSERRQEVWTPRGKRAIWLPVKEKRPNHDWDISCMGVAFQAKAGIIGSDEAEEKLQVES